MSTTRPSCTATTDAFGALIRSTSCSGAGAALALAAEAEGAAAGDEPGVAGCAAEAPLDAGEPVLAAVGDPPSDEAFAVALEGEAAAGAQATRLPVTGTRPSVRPVRVAITLLGY